MASLLKPFNDIFRAELVELVEERALLGGVVGVGVRVIDQPLQTAVGPPEGPKAHPVPRHHPVDEPPNRGNHGRVGGGGLRSVGCQCAEAERGAGVRGGRAGEGGGRGGERQPAPRGQRRGERAEEEGGLERAHGGGGGRASPARWEARDLERGAPPFVYPF